MAELLGANRSCNDASAATPPDCGCATCTLVAPEEALVVIELRGLNTLGGGLGGTDFVIASLPSGGTLYQFDASAADNRSAEITSAGAALTDAGGDCDAGPAGYYCKRVLYEGDLDYFNWPEQTYDGTVVADGPDLFDYELRDAPSGAVSARETVHVRVRNVNDAPVLTGPARVSVQASPQALFGGLALHDPDRGLGYYRVTLALRDILDTLSELTHKQSGLETASWDKWQGDMSNVVHELLGYCPHAVCDEGPASLQTCSSKCADDDGSQETKLVMFVTPQVLPLVLADLLFATSTDAERLHTVRNRLTLTIEDFDDGEGQMVPGETPGELVSRGVAFLRTQLQVDIGGPPPPSCPAPQVGFGLAEVLPDPAVAGGIGDRLYLMESNGIGPMNSVGQSVDDYEITTTVPGELRVTLAWSYIDAPNFRYGASRPQRMQLSMIVPGGDPDIYVHIIDQADSDAQWAQFVLREGHEQPIRLRVSNLNIPRVQRYSLLLTAPNGGLNRTRSNATAAVLPSATAEEQPLWERILILVAASLGIAFLAVQAVGFGVKNEEQARDMQRRLGLAHNHDQDGKKVEAGEGETENQRGGGADGGGATAPTPPAAPEAVGTGAAAGWRYSLSRVLLRAPGYGASSESERHGLVS